MSNRRSRQNRQAHKANGNSRSSLACTPKLRKWLLIVPVVCVLLLLAVYSYATRFMHSEEFRQKVAHKASAEIGVALELSDLRWSGLHVETDGFSAASDGALERIEVVNMELDVDTNFWVREVWEVSDAELDSALLKLDLRKAFTEYEAPYEPASWLDDWMPQKVKVNNATVQRVAAEVMTDTGLYGLDRARLTLLKEDYGYRLELNQGELSLPYSFLSAAELAHAKMRMIGQNLVVDDVTVRVLNGAKMQLAGELDTYSKAYTFSGVVTDLDFQDVVGEDWKQRLEGAVEAKFVVKSHAGLQPEVSGDLVVKDGSLTALPVLDTIASYTGVSAFKQLKFSDFSCHFYKHGELLRLTEISGQCGGLLRIEGRLDITGKALDGKFRLGLSPSALQNIPGAENNVFHPGESGLSWATITISGTTDDVQEDITDRLKAAAFARVLEVFVDEGVVKFGQATAGQVEDLANGNSLESARDIGRKVLEGGLETLDPSLLKDQPSIGADLIEAGLNGLFGTPKKPKSHQQK